MNSKSNSCNIIIYLVYFPQLSIELGCIEKGSHWQWKWSIEEVCDDRFFIGMGYHQGQFLGMQVP